MFKLIKPLFLICETPLHAGSGSDLGVVDLPIQRERHTSFPKIEGSSLKGALREAFETKLGRKNSDISALFGPEDAGNDGHMGALGLSDARLLLFPVKSMKGIFAWVTCPKVLKQFERDMKIGNKDFQIGNIPNVKEGNCVVLDSDSNVVINNKYVLLEEYAFNVTIKKDITITDKINGTPYSINGWLASDVSKENFFQEKMNKDIVILSNDDFKDFVNLSTEVITRTKINNDTGTVQPGALFTEEFLPAESVLYSLAMAAPPFRKKGSDKYRNLKNEKDVMQSFVNTITDKLKVVQIGGNATLGKGIVRTQIK